MGRARDISKVFSTGTALATDSEISAFNYLTQASASTVYQTKASAGLTLLTPASIANTGGTASIGANGTITFSAASTVSLNDVFSATYTNYKIIWNIEHSVGLVALLTRLRVAGTDASGTNYNFMQFNADGTLSGSRSQNQTYNELGLASVDVGNDGSADISRPFLAQPTSWIAQSKTRYNSPYGRNHWAEHTLSTSYTGFTIYVATGAISGTVSVYGYNK
jgi:hypothetical protein